MYKYSVCMYLCAPHVYMVPKKPEEAIRSSGIRVVCYHMGARDQIQVLCKSSKHS